MDFPNWILFFLTITKCLSISQGIGELWPKLFKNLNPLNNPNWLDPNHNGKNPHSYIDKMEISQVNDLGMIREDINNQNRNPQLIQVNHKKENQNGNLAQESNENLFVFLNKGQPRYLPLDPNDKTRVSHYPLNVNGIDVNDEHILQKNGLLNNDFQRKPNRDNNKQQIVGQNLLKPKNQNKQMSRKRNCKPEDINQKKKQLKTEKNKDNNNNIFIQNTAIEHQHNYHISYKNSSLLDNNENQQQQNTQESSDSVLGSSQSSTRSPQSENSNVTLGRPLGFENKEKKTNPDSDNENPHYSQENENQRNYEPEDRKKKEEKQRNYKAEDADSDFEEYRSFKNNKNQRNYKPDEPNTDFRKPRNFGKKKKQRTYNPEDSNQFYKSPPDSEEDEYEINDEPEDRFVAVGRPKEFRNKKSQQRFQHEDSDTDFETSFNSQEYKKPKNYEPENRNVAPRRLLGRKRKEKQQNFKSNDFNSNFEGPFDNRRDNEPENRNVAPGRPRGRKRKEKQQNFSSKDFDSNFGGSFDSQEIENRKHNEPENRNVSPGRPRGRKRKEKQQNFKSKDFNSDFEGPHNSQENENKNNDELKNRNKQQGRHLEINNKEKQKNIKDEDSDLNDFRRIHSNEEENQPSFQNGQSDVVLGSPRTKDGPIESQEEEIRGNEDAIEDNGENIFEKENSQPKSITDSPKDSRMLFIPINPSKPMISNQGDKTEDEKQPNTSEETEQPDHTHMENSSENNDTDKTISDKETITTNDNTLANPDEVDLRPSENRQYAYVTKLDPKSGNMTSKKNRSSLGKLEGKYLDPLAYETIRMNSKNNEKLSSKSKRYARMRPLQLQKYPEIPNEVYYNKEMGKPLIYFVNDKFDSQRRSPFVGNTQISDDDYYLCKDDDENNLIVGSGPKRRLKNLLNIFKKPRGNGDSPLVGNNMFDLKKNILCEDENENGQILGSPRQRGNGNDDKYFNNYGQHPSFKIGNDDGYSKNPYANGGSPRNTYANGGAPRNTFGNDGFPKNIYGNFNFEGNNDDFNDDGYDANDYYNNNKGDKIVGLPHGIGMNQFTDRMGNVTPANPETLSQLC